MHVRLLTVAIIALVLGGGSAGVMVNRASASPGSAVRHLRLRPDKADWQKIQTAAGLRSMALARHRTDRFRSFAALLGLKQLVAIHTLAPGRCRTAVVDLYDNLLDLHDAYPGENWNPLRRAVAKEPSINACAPRRRPADHLGAVWRDESRRHADRRRSR